MSRIFKVYCQWCIRLLTICFLTFYLVMTISGYFAKFQKIIYPGKNVLLIGTIVALGFFALIWGGRLLAIQTLCWLACSNIDTFNNSKDHVDWFI
ncbi:hypothetical protein [Lentilactobacillus hilgardii]|uniref:hypothetical protein n=1 Tax=Lentilactobacillus hilgardii TaxID=1588 RepID=UPI0021E9A638|nr:hypothetical protein [Lentilactobacillus hilgardii]MCV3739798.1 hypothetical protein [Lentilactobacillus hilgardii]